MTTVSDILLLDLQEDIKNVIDLEDRSEAEIQSEIESYIVTEGIGKHLGVFADQYTSNIKETGVWLSGFYGSGKSYFGKMLGYIIDNPIINGTSARERFIPRLKGISNADLIENSIRNMDKINSRVVFLDVAKQNTDRGLAFTLFSNLLRNLGLRGDIYGYMEYDLLVEGKLDEFEAIVESIESQPWSKIKRNDRKVARVVRQAYQQMGYSESDYEDTRELYNNAILDFSSSKFKEVLNRYFEFKPEETIVFIFDEASEAISQRKFTLLDLEGVSESLSSVTGRVWTIAIAQEKLDDVINNANVSRSNLIKVTDRFKTKIHLESTEVDVIIRSRLLQKTKEGQEKLIAYYGENTGLISDATTLKSSFPTVTKDAEEFAIYYPFHRYQFDILQKFLFSSNALVATQIAARGMIITTFDILKKQMRDKELFAFTRGFEVCDEAQTSPPVELVNKYDIAKKTLKASSIDIDGEKLLKTIHILADSEVVNANIENITKSFISDITSYFEFKPKIEKALELLIDAKVLLVSNNNCKITSDLEGKILEEMKGLNIELFRKKSNLTKFLDNYKLFNNVATLSDGTDSFKFHVETDSQETLVPSNTKDLKIVVYSLFNIDDDRESFIEQKKLDTQNDKDTLTIIPDTSEFHKIDSLIEEIERYRYIESQYSNEQDLNKRQIIREFEAIRTEKEQVLRSLIEDAYHNSTIVYMYDTSLLNAISFKSIINSYEEKVVKNLYTKRLSSQLSEKLVSKIFNDHKENLHKLFSADDFKFFTEHGQFQGENLRVVEEINAKLKSRYIDGGTLESELSRAPWGYSFGTIVSTLAALLRASKLTVKYSGETYFSHDNKAVHEAFLNTTKFKSASFKSNTASLDAKKKNDAIHILMDLSVEDYIDKKVDWSISDFDLANSIRDLSERFIQTVQTLSQTESDFDKLFPSVIALKDKLHDFSGKVTENNYIERVELLVLRDDEFSKAIDTIVKTQKFIRKSLPKAKRYKSFVENVGQVLSKADRTSILIDNAVEEFFQIYNGNLVKGFNQLEAQVQIIKDEYFKLMTAATKEMSEKYQKIKIDTEAAKRELEGYPSKPNAINFEKLNKIIDLVDKRIVDTPSLNDSVSCSLTGYTLADVLNYSALAPKVSSDLAIIQASFITKEPTVSEVSSPTQVEEHPQVFEGVSNESTPTTPKMPYKVTLSLQGRVMTVQEYKRLLTKQIRELANLDDELEVQIQIEE